MTTAGDDAARDPVDLLAEQFAARRRSGEALGIEQFVARHPAHADALREVLPALLALEEARQERVATSHVNQRVAVPQLERLGDFRIIRELGRGGMGVVFEAVQESLGRRVALKVLPQAALLSGQQLERFRREARIAARLHHSNIVPVYGSGESDGFYWYAMQFIDGSSLDRIAARAQGGAGAPGGAALDHARRVARLGVAAAAALHYAHQLGTLHRDLKPGNLLVDRSDHLWVTDFGLAKALETEGLTDPGDLLGTLQYMAPEQLRGSYDARSEVYALGVTLYELLAGRPAFAGSTRSEVLERVRAGRPPPLLSLCPGLSPDLAVVIGKAMAPDPADRYPDAAALQSDLDAFLADRPIAARRLSRAALLLRWGRRNRALATLAATTGLAIVAAAVVGWAAYGATGEALRRTEAAAEEARRQSDRAEANLRLSLAAFGGVFDALVGRDPALAVDEDPDTGEQTVVVRTAVAARDVELLQRMLVFYDDFAAQNATSQSLRYEAARACRRVGAIHARLGHPDNLDAAEQAFGKALAGFAGISDRDVARDLAAVHLELGRLQQRRGRVEIADSCFRAALAALGELPGSGSRAVQFDRAEVHFELARNAGFRPGWQRDGRDHLRTALELVRQLQHEPPVDPDWRALEARCLLENARRRRWPGDEQQPAAAGRDEEAGRAIAILRQLVADHPGRAGYRYDLCDAIVNELAAGGARRLRRPGVDEVAQLREAEALAQQLCVEQPLFQEYRALLGRASCALGHALHAHSRAPSVPSAVAAELRQEAETALMAALEIAVAQAAGGSAPQGRFVRQLLEARRELAVLYEATGRRSAAVAQLHALLDALEQAAEDLGGSAGRALEGRPPPDRALVTLRSRPPAGVGDDLVRRLADQELAERFAQWRDRLRARSR